MYNASVCSCSDRVLVLFWDSYRTVKSRLKPIICQHTLIERTIHSMSCIMPGFARVPILVYELLL